MCFFFRIVFWFALSDRDLTRGIDGSEIFDSFEVSKQTDDSLGLMFDWNDCVIVVIPKESISNDTPMFVIFRVIAIATLLQESFFFDLLVDGIWNLTQSQDQRLNQTLNFGSFLT